jgi:hypothetical protein
VAEVRKLAAILAADVVGYSRMMGEDDAGTVRERREAAAPILAGHGVGHRCQLWLERTFEARLIWRFEGSRAGL